MVRQKRQDREFLNSVGILFVSAIINRQGFNAFQGRKLCKAQYKTMIIPKRTDRERNYDRVRVRKTHTHAVIIKSLELKKIKAI